MAQHKAPTAVTLAPTHEESAFRQWVERYWKLVAVVIAVVVIYVIFDVQKKSSLESVGQESWSKLLNVAAPDPMTGFLSGSPEDLRRIESEVSGSPAGPWALYLAATSAAAKSDFEGAKSAVDELQRKYPNHTLVNQPLLDEAGSTLPAARVLTNRIAAMAAFMQNNPGLFGNPELPPDAPRVRLTTDKGVIVVGLYSNLAPKQSDNFLKLVRSGFYNGTKFHNVVNGEFIQGGDPNSNKGDPETWGKGGPGYALEKESVSLRHFAGVISVVPDPQDPSKSSGSQFLITSTDVHNFDDSHVPFGKILEGSDVVRAIEQGPLAEKSFTQPKDPATLVTAEAL